MANPDDGAELAPDHGENAITAPTGAGAVAKNWIWGGVCVSGMWWFVWRGVEVV